jgi:RimJ/RimL family protein N-acetyltransferase
MYTIELAKSSDAKAMLNYLKSVGSETDFLLFGDEGVDLTLEQEAEFLDGINKTSHSRMFVVKDNDKIVATAHIQGRTKTRTRHKAVIGISVLKEYWGKGIGSMLLKKLIEFAKDNAHIEILYLEVISTNNRAISLYKKFNFITYATDESSTKVGNIYFDNLLMRLDLNKLND